MNEYKVEKGVPVPPASVRAGGTKYPWPDMGVGDSFVVPVPAGEQFERVRNRVRNNWDHWRKRHPSDHRTIATRREGDGFRVWVLSRNGKP
jgi:hypothetical protein